MISIVPVQAEPLRPRVGVFGVGGAGNNAVDTMIAAGIEGVDFVAADTDAQALNGSLASRRIQLGRTATDGLGAGSNPEIGKAAAQEALEEVGQALEGAHMCFIAAGMGGGTGTGAASIIAQAARAKGILTVGVVTLPFAFEGRRRSRSAEEGVAELEKHVDTLIIIPNQNLFRITSPDTTVRDAFGLADAVLQQGVRGITDLMLTPGLVNLDFADIRSIMGGMGRAMMASGESSGPNRAIEAADMAIFNPLLDGEMKGARGLIISIVGGEDLLLAEIDQAAGHIKDVADPEADIIWGSAIDPALAGRMRISIVATGLGVDARSDEGTPRDAVAQQPSRPEPSPTRPAADEAAVLDMVAQPPHPEPARVDPEPVCAAQAAFTGLVAEAPVTTAETEAGDETEATGDLFPDQPELSFAAEAPPVAAVPAAAPAAGASLFQRLAMLARGGVQAELYEDRLPRDCQSGGPAFYNRRAGGVRQ